MFFAGNDIRSESCCNCWIRERFWVWFVRFPQTVSSRLFHSIDPWKRIGSSFMVRLKAAMVGATMPAADVFFFLNTLS